MTEMSKKKSPFKGYTLKQIKDAENILYVIQLGDNIYVHEDGQMSFPKDRAEAIYKVLYAGLADMLKNGTFDEREDARNTFKSFRLMPLRFN